jgi:hypothetical protein
MGVPEMPIMMKSKAMTKEAVEVAEEDEEGEVEAGVAVVLVAEEVLPEVTPEDEAATAERELVLPTPTIAVRLSTHQPSTQPI